MSIKLTVRIDRPALKRALNEADGPVAVQLSARRRRLERRAKAEAPKRTGNLASTVYSAIEEKPQLQLVLGARADYALFVHEGTGIYGPRRRPIVAKPGRVFAFEGRDGRMVFTRRIKGQKPNRFLLRAISS